MQKRKNKSRGRGLLDRTPALEGLDAPFARVDAGALGKASPRPSKRAAKKKHRKLKPGERHPTLAERNRKQPAAPARRHDPDEAMRRHAAAISTDLRSGGLPTLRDRVLAEGFKTQLRGANYGSLRSGKGAPKKRAAKKRQTKKPEAKATTE